MASDRDTPDFQEMRVLRSLDDVWQTAIEIEAGLPYMRHGDFLRHLRNLKRRGLATTRRSDAHGRWEYAITEAGERVVDRGDLRAAIPSSDAGAAE